jgi:hemerythrin-like domain-containing protein
MIQHREKNSINWLMNFEDAKKSIKPIAIHCLHIRAVILVNQDSERVESEFDVYGKYNIEGVKRTDLIKEIRKWMDKTHHQHREEYVYFRFIK